MDANVTRLAMNFSQINVNTTAFITTKSMEAATVTGSASNSSSSNPLPGLKYTYAALMIIILMVIIVANIALISVICLYKKLHTTTNVFIANLALGDTIMAFTVIPFDIDRLLRGHFAFDARVCEISSTVFFLSLPASTLNLSILTLERFCAIRFPLKHRTGRIFTTKRKVIILISSWVYIAITASLPVMGWRSFPTVVIDGQCLFHFETEYALFQLCANFILPLLLIVVMNVLILQIARNGLESRFISRKSSTGALPILRKSSGVSGVSLRHRATGRKVSRQSSAMSPEANKKATKIIAMLVGVFAFCWLPYIINIAVNIICKGCLPQEVTTATMILVFLNSATNPILYGIYKPQIRSSLKEVYTKVTYPVCFIKEDKRCESHPVDKDIEITCI